jgi:hypothetical protein
MVLALLIACTFGLTWVTDMVYQRVDRGLRSA